MNIETNDRNFRISLEGSACAANPGSAPDERSTRESQGEQQPRSTPLCGAFGFVVPAGTTPRLLIHRQGPDGPVLVSALTPEQVVQIALENGPRSKPAIPEELGKILQEQELEVITEAGDSWQQARISGCTEYKTNRSSGILRSAVEFAPTKDQAIRELARKLSGKLMVIDAYSPSRREIQIPELSL